MRKSELKEMIKLALSEDVRTDAEQEGYEDGFDDAKDDIEAKLKDMKVSEGDNYYEDSIDEAEEVDVDVEDESIESDIEVDASMPDESETEITIQSLLMKAQEEATKLGDEKLTDQIGNTITYFTRAHVAQVDEVEVTEESTIENLDESTSRFTKLAGIIK